MMATPLTNQKEAAIVSNINLLNQVVSDPNTTIQQFKAAYLLMNVVYGELASQYDALLKNDKEEKVCGYTAALIAIEGKCINAILDPFYSNLDKWVLRQGKIDELNEADLSILLKKMDTVRQAVLKPLAETIWELSRYTLPTSKIFSSRLIF